MERKTFFLADTRESIAFLMAAIVNSADRVNMLQELSLPHAATCMLGLPDASLLLCVENGCPLKLTPRCSGVGLAQMLQSDSSSAIADLMANSKRHKHLSKAAVVTRVDWGGCPLRDFVVMKNQGIDEVSQCGGRPGI